MKLPSKLVVALLIILCNCTYEKEKVLTIDGTVINSDTKSIILMKPDEDYRNDSVIEIPVVGGKFHYEAKLQHPEAVELCLDNIKQGSWRPMPLFLENTHINLTIYSEDEFDRNLVEGGKLNAEYAKYKNELDSKFKERLQPLEDSIDILWENDQFHSDEMKEVQSKIHSSATREEALPFYKMKDELMEQGLDKSPQAKALADKYQLIEKEMKKHKQEYISENPSIVSYYLFLRDIQRTKKNIDLIVVKSNYEKLVNANPDHRYNELALGYINAIDKIGIGKSFVDFSAPDLNDQTVKLSDQIEGQVALLDLWATWCGPCIAKSRTMVPVYNEYKDKGFTIVGVAGEFDDTKKLTRFLEKEKWPWLQLVELDRQNKIWNKYGVDNGGGGIFLIDKVGTIIAIDPTADEVRNELTSRLN